MAKEEHIAVTNFRKYLRINTMHPNPDYASACKFLCDYGKELGLEVRTVEPVAGKPFVILTLIGQKPDLPTVWLYSHTDVVPVFPEHWTHDPFSADKDEKGDIYARGSQDMKCVGIQHLEAIRILKAQGKCNFLRTVHIVFGPEEEVGAKEGMGAFVNHDIFKSLNIGFELDEGLASEDDVYKVYYAERCIWWIKVTFSGNPGHGSKFIENTAAEKFHKVAGKFLNFREEQRQKLLKNPDLCLGDVVSVNMTMMEGGVQFNVVPSEITAGFDIRVPPTTDFDKLIALFESWFKEAGDGIKWEFAHSTFIKNMTSTDPSDPWWKAFSGVLDKMNLKYKKEMFLGATDARFLRERGIGAFNFSPMINTPILLHDHDERLNEKVFLDGLEIYCQLIPAMANVPEQRL